MLVGDMAIKDLSPRDDNSGGRLIKNLRICGSGLYEYHISEAPLMGLTIPGDYKDQTFKIFRSKEVLRANKDLYARIPIITGHHVRVNRENAKDLTVGMVGDTVTAEEDENDNELYLYTTGTIVAEDGVEAYEKYGELSVGYDPKVEWEEGEYKGQKYQAVLKGFNEINHLLICKTARGGHQCMIMDSLPEQLESRRSNALDIDIGGKAMGIFKKIFAKPTPKITGDSAVVSALLQSIKVGADAKVQVSKVRDMMGDAVDTRLNDYFDELSGDEVKQADNETLCKAVDVVDEYCQKCMGDEDKAKEKEEPKSETLEPGCADEKKPEESKDKAKEKEEPKSEEKSDEKSTGDSIDYDRIINGVVAKLESVKKDVQKLAGDEMEVSKLQVLLNGDEKNTVTSDEVMKSIWG